MAFSIEIASWWKRVARNKCHYIWYKDGIDFDEGWKICGRLGEEVHHLTGDAWLKERGVEPNDAVGLLLCRHHHRLFPNINENGDEIIIHNKNFSFHPDAAEALTQYKAYKERVLLFGRQAAGKDPFHEMMERHKVDSKKGIRYWASPWEVDLFYTAWMSCLASEYTFLHPDDPKPPFDRRFPLPRRRHWSYKCFPDG